jgi:phage shock protein PspC (stress-responsive transcriptional regulator)
MKLTSKQEALIGRYLRDVALRLDRDMTERTREQALDRLDFRIRKALGTLQKEQVEDRDVVETLRELGSPETMAAEIDEKFTQTAGVTADKTPRVIWLGVAFQLAERVGIEAWMARLGFFIAGLFTGPLAIIGYLGAYAEMRYRNPDRPYPPIDWVRVITRTVGVIIVAVLLARGTDYAIDGINYLHTRFLNEPLPSLGDWGWILSRKDSYIGYVYMICVPLAFISGFPLANNWDRTLLRIAQAGLCLCGIAIAYGLAGLLTGIILQLVEDAGGLNLYELLEF